MEEKFKMMKSFIEWFSNTTKTKQGIGTLCFLTGVLVSSFFGYIQYKEVDRFELRYVKLEEEKNLWMNKYLDLKEETPTIEEVVNQFQTIQDMFSTKKVENTKSIDEMREVIREQKKQIDKLNRIKNDLYEK